MGGERGGSLAELLITQGKLSLTVLLYVVISWTYDVFQSKISMIRAECLVQIIVGGSTTGINFYVFHYFLYRRR